MGLSKWRLAWCDDFDRVVLSMSRLELETLRSSGLSSSAGRPCLCFRIAPPRI